MKKIFLLLFLFSLNIILNAQSGTWTWMHGGGASPAAGNYGTQGVAAATNVPPALYEAAEWTDLNGNFWIFGGALAVSGVSATMWMYNPTTNMWTWMKGPGAASINAGNYGTKGVSAPTNNPGARGRGSLTWTDNQGNLWLFGGQGFDAFANYDYLNDLWKYNITTNEWTWVSGSDLINSNGNYGTQGVAAPTNEPPNRCESAASWVDNNNNLWMFGGTGKTGALNDLWKYNIITNEWTWMRGWNSPGAPNLMYGTQGLAAATNDPCARDVYSKWKDKNGNLWLFGGTRNGIRYNDLWKYDITTNMWTWMKGSVVGGSAGSLSAQCVSAASNEPSSRYENRTCWTDTCGNFWMFGGVNGNVNVLNDLWYYDVTKNEWSLARIAGATSNGTILVPNITNLLSPRFGGNPFSLNDGNLWMFSGSGGSNEMWKFVIDTACVGSCYVPPVLPNASFSGTNLSGCANLTVNFSNNSTNANSWNWAFGDGNNSTSQNPSNTYTTPGQYTVTLIASDGTNNDTSVLVNYVTVYANANAAFSATNDTLCLGQSVTFNNASTNSNGSSWNFGDSNTSAATSPSHTYGATGNYTVTLIAQNANGCHDTVTSNVTVLSNFTLTQNASVCNGQSYTLPGGTIVNTVGTYVDTLNSSGGCDSIITTNLSILPFLTSTQNPVICFGSNYTLPGGNIVNTAGSYMDTLTAINGCDSIITTNLTLAPFLTSTQNPIICTGNNFILPGGTTVNTGGVYVDTLTSFGGCDSIITTTLVVSANSSSNQTTSICTGNNFTLPDGTIVNVSGTYIDTLQNAKGCDSIITTILTVNPLPTATANSNVTISKGQSTTLVATGGGTYNWIPATGLNTTTNDSVIASPTVTTIYCVEVTDNNGCKDTACVTVKVEIPCPTNENLNVPNAFSPNTDGVNDEFCLQGWDACLENFSIVIFDRWGEKVFESKDPNFCWDGTFRNTIMDAQVFVYYIKARFLNLDKHIIKKGNISLIR